MNVEPILLALQAAFLVLLYVFIWRVVRTAGKDMQVAPQESFILAPSQLAAEHPAADPGRLVVERSKALEVGSTFDAGPVPVTVGRSAENTISLDGDDFASGQHARIESQRDGIWILDLGSTNGTFVNGERVDRRRQLHRGDLVQIGDTELRFER
ncbi:MAG TPA: FHA domain-containing protein [Gaiellaceae bacterium]|jgi:pSer/pThr/pTyr-binding forkhead associated (FHA) protein